MEDIQKKRKKKENYLKNKFMNFFWSKLKNIEKNATPLQ